FLCDGEGSCTQSSVDWAPARCDTDSCTGGCAADPDCADGAHCSSSGTCESNFAEGFACQYGGDCDSGFCVEGVCCNTRCNEGGTTCSRPDAPGQCLPVLGDDACPVSCSSTSECESGLACSPTTHTCEAVSTRAGITRGGCTLAAGAGAGPGGGAMAALL